MARKSATRELRKGDKVIAVAPVGDIPEGANGVVKMVAGQAWTRYWVKWDNGEWIGTVDGASIVRADRLEEYRAEQVAAAAKATADAARPVAAAALTEGSGGGGGDGRVPEHLLERSRQARARALSKAAS